MTAKHALDVLAAQLKEVRRDLEMSEESAKLLRSEHAGAFRQLSEVRAERDASIELAKREAVLVVEARRRARSAESALFDTRAERDALKNDNEAGGRAAARTAMKLLTAESALADTREALRDVLSQDQPWSLSTVLAKLREWTAHALDHHSCDCHGYEEASACVGRANGIDVVLTRAARVLGSDE